MRKSVCHPLNAVSQSFAKGTTRFAIGIAGAPSTTMTTIMVPTTMDMAEKDTTTEKDTVEKDTEAAMERKAASRREKERAARKAAAREGKRVDTATRPTAAITTTLLDMEVMVCHQKT